MSLPTPINLKVDDLKPNPWNYNQQKDGTFSKLAASIRRHGFTRPLIVRTLDDGSREIIDGEHGWKAAKLLGMTHVPCVDLGRVSDSRAKEMTIVLNELGGTPDEARLADLMREISGYADGADVMAIMPYSKSELDLLTKQIDFGFTSAPKVDQRPAPKPEEQKAIQDKHAKVRVDFVGDEAAEVESLLAGKSEAFILETIRELSNGGS